MQQLFRVSVKRPENDSYLNPLEPKVFFRLVWYQISQQEG